MTNKDSSTEKIRTLNDAFRKTLLGGRFALTPGVAALSPEEQNAVLQKVRLFDDFTKGNDPYGEHDFGAFEHGGDRFFWKIDYYDRSLECGSEDPSNPEETTRMMTVMLANEY